MQGFFGTWDLRRRLLTWFLLVAMVPMVLITAANLFLSARNLRREMGDRLAANRKGAEIELQKEEKRLLNQAERYAAQSLLVQTIASSNREMIKRLLVQLLEFSDSGLLGIYDAQGTPISIVQKTKAKHAASLEPVRPNQTEKIGLRPPSFGVSSAYAEEDFTFDIPPSGESKDTFTFDGQNGSASPSVPAGVVKDLREGPLPPEVMEQLQANDHAVVRTAQESGVEVSVYQALQFSGRRIGILREGAVLNQDFIDGMKHRVGLEVALVDREGRKVISTLSGLDAVVIKEAVAAPIREKIGGGEYLYMALPLIEKNGVMQGGIVLLQPLDSLLSSQREITVFSLILFGGVGIVVAMVSLRTARSISRPLHQIMEVLKRAEQQGDLTQRIDIKSRDEIGELGRWFNTFSEKFSGIISRVKDSTRSLAVSSEELSASSQQMGSNSEQTEKLASTVSSASEQTSRNVQAVATAAEEMTATLKEISQNVMKATQITSEAVQMAQGTNRTISKLGESSAEIGKVIKVITSIAEQTNLLALNAAIEAARAGEAGKGFAVVANEVKDLAKKTARATEEIGQKIGVIQTDTKEAVSAIGEITGIITQINEIATTIAGAIEEQTATTNEIGRSVMEAARGTGEVTESIDGVVIAAKGTAEGATTILAASKRLAQMGAELMAMVSQFHVEADRIGSGDPKDTFSVQKERKLPLMTQKAEPLSPKQSEVV
ncbi:methyl-accepting chemotaxis protein [Candidatus Manganitrophus noduliformans]|uniref:Methyl-accepting chemotaxis protein n=1 Tax=Candidatus Manganitrophus noduliformans TaxID=2606439 RepID=A0A7X6DTF8_9BACT|nr:methyl-accepting chemotaxis protein [Candidatus Manganitrophus noduliformans]NKE73077.1 methyl-accepting chemotaxis protein [Candidatus Manganitrophus noduliformans]